MKPTHKGPGIDWPISGWPRHGPLVVAFLVVLAALIAALLLFADRPAGNGPDGDSDLPVQPIDQE